MLAAPAPPPRPRCAFPPLGDNPFCSPLEPQAPPHPQHTPCTVGVGAARPLAVHHRCTPGPRHRLLPALCQPWPMDGAAGGGAQDYFSIITFWCTVIFSCNLISRELPPEPIFNLMDVDITLERLSY